MPLALPNKKAEDRLVPINEFIRMSELSHALRYCLSGRIKVGDDLKYLTRSHLVQGQERFERRIWTPLSPEVKMAVNLWYAYDMPPFLLRTLLSQAIGYSWIHAADTPI
jgi:hypothetical protein